MRPSSPFSTITTLVGGGLNIVDAPDQLAEGQARELNNFISGARGRISPRKSATMVAQVPGQIVGIEMFPHGSYPHASGETYAGVAILTWVSGVVDLYLADGAGQKPYRMGSLAGWSPVATRPRVSMAVINRRLFVTDETKTHGLTVFDPFYDPTNSGSGVPTFYQPSFIFDPIQEAGKMLPRCVVVYNNFLLVAGYGTQGEPSRPEIVRFSYLGLQEDGEGGGDAGYISDILNDPPVPTPAETARNLNLFDVEDYFMVGERGTPVVAMAPALGRLIIGTPYSTWVLFGYDRDSFQLELLDNTRGCTGTNAMIAANGLVYWWSPVGPVRWTGSSVEEIGREVYADIDKLDPEKVVAVHAKSASEVRFYQGNRGFAFNYKTAQWSRITLPESVNVWCAGYVSPFTSTNTGAAAPRIGPAAPPSGLSFENITASSAVAVWTNGDSAPEVLTEVSIKRTSDAEWGTPAGTLPSGSNRMVLNGLAEGVSYDVRVAHLKGVQETAYATGSFLTRAATVETTLAAPKRMVAKNDPLAQKIVYAEDDIGLSGMVWAASAIISWEVTEDQAGTEVYRAAGLLPDGRDDLANYLLVQSVDPYLSSCRDGGQTGDNNPLEAGGYFTYVVRHKRAGMVSDLSEAVTVLVTKSKKTVTKPEHDPAGRGWADEGGRSRELVDRGSV